MSPPAMAARARVLVVDDEPLMSVALKRALRGRYDIVAVSGAAQALDLLASDRFDIILTDWFMPNMSGGELYQAIKTRFPQLVRRVIFMTGGAKVDEGLRCLSKPFDMAQMERLFAEATSMMPVG